MLYKIWVLALATFILSFSCSTGVDGTDDPEQEEYTVTLHANYSGASPATYGSTIVSRGDVFDRPVDPTRSGYSFDGWCTDAAGLSPYDFTTKVTADLDLYANWDNSVDLESAGNASYFTFSELINTIYEENINSGTFSTNNVRIYSDGNGNEIRTSLIVDTGTKAIQSYILDLTIKASGEHFSVLTYDVTANNTIKLDIRSTAFTEAKINNHLVLTKNDAIFSPRVDGSEVALLLEDTDDVVTYFVGLGFGKAEIASYGMKKIVIKNDSAFKFPSGTYRLTDAY